DKSADVCRYWAGTGSLGRDIIFSDEELKNGSKLVNKLWNASKFALSFLDGFKPEDDVKNAYEKLLPVDKWILAKFSSMQNYFKNYFNNYEIGLALGELEKFFWNFCDDYIEIAKRRLYNPDVYGQEATDSAKVAVFYVLREMLKMFGIFMPHITEEIWQKSYVEFENKPSIHNTELVFFDIKDNEIIALGDALSEIVSAVRRYKTENGLSQKEELSSLEISGYKGTEIFEGDIKAVGTIKNIIFTDAEEKEIKIQK
ncbi:MAG: class I tRNA ligase family protein, partial [Clostridia bacterium]|nr:class I tRNA ligase family protein [Clostridia bacterium]